MATSESIVVMYIIFSDFFVQGGQAPTIYRTREFFAMDSNGCSRRSAELSVGCWALSPFDLPQGRLLGVCLCDCQISSCVKPFANLCPTSLSVIRRDLGGFCAIPWARRWENLLARHLGPC